CAIDKYWTMLLLSDGCRELTGYSAEEICHNLVVCYEEIIEPEDRDRVRHQLNAAIVEQSPFTIEYRIRCKGGSLKWVRERGATVIDESGALVLEGIVSDITEWVATQSSLVEAELRYRSIF